MEWKSEPGLIAYEDALEQMAARVAAIQQGKAEELLWLLEHPPLYTAGTSAKASDLLRSQFPVYETGRGGQYTYHGPGQRVAYLMLDLNRRGKDIRAYVQKLERWIILTLAEFGIEGFVREGRVGVWVQSPANGAVNRQRVAEGEPLGTRGVSVATPLAYEHKIAAIGVRVQKWVTSHGIAINVSPDLSHYAGIVPCGIKEHGVTSLAALGKKTSLLEVDMALKRNFSQVFLSES